MAFQLSPDPLGHDEDVLTQSEMLDEDSMDIDPLEGGMDPAEDWSAANRYGTTAVEQATDQPLTERLKEEQPDVSTEPAPEHSVTATPVEEIDEWVDDEVIPGRPASDQGQAPLGEVGGTG